MNKLVFYINDVLHSLDIKPLFNEDIFRSSKNSKKVNKNDGAIPNE